MQSLVVSNFEKRLKEKLAIVYKNKICCDLTIICPNGKVEAHSLFVGTYIPAFGYGTKHISKFSKDCMECLMEIIYFGEKKVPLELMDEVIRAVKWYKVDGLEIEAQRLSPIPVLDSVLKEDPDRSEFGEPCSPTLVPSALDSVKKEDPDRSEFGEPCSPTAVPSVLDSVKREDPDRSELGEPCSPTVVTSVHEIPALDSVEKEDPDRSKFEEPCSLNVVPNALEIPALVSVKKEDPDRSEFEEPLSPTVVPSALDFVKKEDPDRSEFGEPCSLTVVPSATKIPALDSLKKENSGRSEFEESSSSTIVPSGRKRGRKSSSSSEDSDKTILDVQTNLILKQISALNRKATRNICVICLKECPNIIRHRKLHQYIRSKKKFTCDCGKIFSNESFVTNHKCK